MQAAQLFRLTPYDQPTSTSCERSLLGKPDKVRIPFFRPLGSAARGGAGGRAGFPMQLELRPTDFRTTPSTLGSGRATGRKERALMPGG